MNVTLEKLELARRNANGLDILKKIYFDSITPQDKLDFEIFELSHTEKIWCLYIGDNTSNIGLHLSRNSDYANCVHAKCNKVYVFGGYNVVILRGISEIISYFGLNPRIIDFTYFRAPRMYNLAGAFEYCRRNIEGIDNLFSKDTWSMVRMFSNCNIDKISISDNVDLSHITNAEKLFNKSIITELDASFLKKLNRECVVKGMFYDTYINRFHMPDILNNFSEHLLFNNTEIDVLYSSERVYNAMLEAGSKIYEFKKI